MACYREREIDFVAHKSKGLETYLSHHAFWNKRYTFYDFLFNLCLCFWQNYAKRI